VNCHSSVTFSFELTRNRRAARERETLMSRFEPISGQFPDLCNNDTFSSPSQFQRAVLLLVRSAERVHLAGLREELFNRVEQLVYIEGFSDTGEVTFLKRLCGQVGAHDDGGDVCEVCDSM